MNDLELEIAKQIIDNQDFKLSDIAKKTGISRQSLSSYRTGKADLENATWKNVHAIAKYPTQVFLANELERDQGAGYINFSIRLKSLLQDFYEQQINNSNSSKAEEDSQAIAKAIQALGVIVDEDPNVKTALYQEYSKYRKK